MNVSATDKDKILNCLCDSLTCESVFSLEMDILIKENDSDFDSLNAILNQFDRLGFISHLNLRRNSLSLALHIEAIDFKNRGGFVGQEEILKMSLEKLCSEIDDLSSKFPDKIQIFTTIATNIATCIGLIKT